MEKPEYPQCGCFSSEKHGDDWADIISGAFQKTECNKVQKGTGCSTCQVKRYTSEATRCQRCEIIRAYLACKHRRPEQLLLFKEEDSRQNP